MKAIAALRTLHMCGPIQNTLISLTLMMCLTRQLSINTNMKSSKLAASRTLHMCRSDLKYINIAAIDDAADAAAILQPQLSISVAHRCGCIENQLLWCIKSNKQIMNK